MSLAGVWRVQGNMKTASRVQHLNAHIQVQLQVQPVQTLTLLAAAIWAGTDEAMAMGATSTRL